MTSGRVIGNDPAPVESEAGTMTRQTGREVRWRGVAASPGIVLGPAFVYRVAQAEPPIRHLVSAQESAVEVRRFDDALQSARNDLQALKRRAPAGIGSVMTKIFDAQLLILDDPSIHDDVCQVITDDQLAAESAFAQVVGRAQQTIARAGDAYLREMVNDIETIKRRVINRLLAVTDGPLHGMSEPAVLLAHTITPADILGLSHAHILALVVETGGPTSHSALVAKSMGIPAVVGVGRDVRVVRTGTRMIVDGYAGVVIVDPRENTTEFFERKRRRSHRPWPKRLDALRDQESVTRDNHRVELLANIDLSGETGLALAAGSDGVGLFRTEYLFLQKGGYPSESQQHKIYSEAAVALGGRPLTVRTFDLGSDKVHPGQPAEDNPALGVRGIRISLRNPSSLERQFRALLAATAEGPFRVMVPMITTLEEFRDVRTLWSAAKAALRAKGARYDAKTPLGLMIETPSAVLLAAELAREADFLSIGTNDLLQYTMAVDRANACFTDWQHHWHPALWRQIASVVRSGHAAHIPVGVCGEMAADPLAVPALVGLRVDSLSAHPNSLPRSKSLIRGSRYQDCRSLATRVLSCATTAEIRKELEHFAKRHVR